MKLQAFVLAAFIISFTLPLVCINHMDLMTTIWENQFYDDFGNGIAALDFNGDGHGDLAVLQLGWDPVGTEAERFGRLLFYYGGPGFDNIADFTIQGAYQWHLVTSTSGSSLANLGDVNGDGCDDLGVRGYTDFGSGSFFDHRPYIAVYFGGQNPASHPGYYKWFPSQYDPGYVEIDPLGDINNDGYDDFSYTYMAEFTSADLSQSAFVLGDSIAFTEIIWRRYSNNDRVGIHASGDVNNDGYYDYTVTYDQYLGPTNNTLYFGSASVFPADSLWVANNPVVWRTVDLGDVNGDGIDDFTGRMDWSLTYVWYGNENITTQYNFTLSPGWCGNGSDDRGLVHGDLNNDGFDDIIGSNPGDYGENGSFRIWLGRAQMNGTSDLTVNCTYATGMQMGTGMAAGDFNADGYCDVAASAPHQSSFGFPPGKVFVFAGNAQLADTTVGIDDNTAGLPDNEWTVTVIPNPVRGRQQWKIRFNGKGYDSYKAMQLKVYNLKGQRVKAINISSAELKAGAKNLPGLDLPAGIYEASLYERGNLLKSVKFTVK